MKRLVRGTLPGEPNKYEQLDRITCSDDELNAMHKQELQEFFCCGPVPADAERELRERQRRDWEVRVQLRKDQENKEKAKEKAEAKRAERASRKPNICRACGGIIPPTGNRGRQPVYHDEHRPQKKAA